MTEYQTKFSGVKDTFPGGATRDAGEGRGRYDLIPPEMILRLAQVYERGAKIHGDDNWRKGIPRARLFCSALRHTYQALAGAKDEDHLAQAIWNLTALIYFEEVENRAAASTHRTNTPLNNHCTATGTSQKTA